MFKKKYIMYCPVCGYVDGEHAKTVYPFCKTVGECPPSLLIKNKAGRVALP